MESKINLGSILSITGEASQDAQGIRDGIELAVKNLKGKGQDVGIHYIDDNSDVVTSVRAIDTLIREHNVSAIIGPTWAFQVDSFAPIIDQEKIVTFAPAVASDSIIKNSDYILFGAEKNIYKESTLKDFVTKNKIKKIGVIISQDKWGVSHLLPIKNVAIQTSAEIVFIEQLIPYISSFGSKYITETLTRALQSSPDMIIWSGYEGEANVLCDLILERKLEIPLISDQLLVTGEREKLKNYQGELYLFSNTFSQDFITMFQSEYNKQPTLYSDIAYDATMILVDILQKNPKISSDQIMKIIKDKNYQYKGLSGTFIFDQFGDIQNSGRWVINKFEK
jgi:branched-chain amino acid transport system substrate-binding protein